MGYGAWTKKAKALLQPLGYRLEPHNECLLIYAPNGRCAYVKVWNIITEPDPVAYVKECLDA